MKKIIGIFKTEEQAVNAIEGLRSSGYKDDEISIITKDEDKYNSLSAQVGTDITNEKNVAGGAAAGAVTGGTIGGLGGLLLGLGALAIPGVGPIIAAGPIAAAVTGALAGGAVGGLAGALIDFGVPEVEAEEYEQRINNGDILVLVEEDEEKRDKAYDHFYKNESENRGTYSHRDRSAAYGDESAVTHNNPEIDMHSGSRNTENNITDSYKTDNEDMIGQVDKNKDLHRITYEKDTPETERQDHDDEHAIRDKGWNKEINKDSEKGNTNHIVEGHETRIKENEPFEAEKPYDLDKNLRDVDQF